MGNHRDLAKAELHECKQIVDSTTADAGKVVTPDGVTDGDAELRKIKPTELDGDCEITDAGKVYTPSASTADLLQLRSLTATEVTNAVSLTGTQTLTNKRITPRISVETYAASIGVDSDSFDILACDSVTADITINAPTGTPTDGQELIVRLTQDGTGSHAVTFNAAFNVNRQFIQDANETTTWRFRWVDSDSVWQDTFTNDIYDDQINFQGWEKSVDDETGDTVISLSTTPALLTIDGGDSASNSDYLPLVIRGTSNLWNTSTNRVDPVVEGDSFNVRLDLEVTNKAGAPTSMTLTVDEGSTGGSITDVVFERDIPVAKTAPFTASVGFPLVADATAAANGFQFFLETDTGTLDIASREIVVVRTGSGANG